MPERCGTNAAVSISAPTRRSIGCRARPSRRTGASRPRVGADQAEQHPQARGLARAVRAEQTAHLALLDREAEVVDREHALAEVLREADDLDDGFGHRRPATDRKLRREGTCGA